MDIEKLKKDYKKYERYYLDFQENALGLLHKIKSEREAEFNNLMQHLSSDKIPHKVSVRNAAF